MSGRPSHIVMKLAQALLERKDLTSHIKSLASRFGEATVLKKGATPEESWRTLLQELESAFDAERELVVKVNRTNNTVLVGQETMMQAIARRDILKKKAEQLDGLLAHVRMDSYRGENEVVVEGFSVAEFRKIIDKVKKELRLLDQEIQQVNWSADLLES